MAKPIKSALKVAAITFLTVTGAVLITGGATGLFATAIGSGTIAAFAGQAAVLSAVGTLVGGLLSKGVEASRENFGTKVSTRSATAPRQIVYGQCRVGGTITHIETLGTENEKLTMVVALAGHEIESLEKVIINDEELTTTTSGGFEYATNTKFTNGDNDNAFTNGRLLRYKFLDGSQTTADSDVTANSSLGTDDKFINVAYVFIQMIFDSEAFGGGIPPMAFVVKGKKVYDPRESGHTFGTESTYEWSDNPALHVLDYITNTDYGLKATSDEFLESDTVGSFLQAANHCDSGNTITTATVDGAVSSSTTIQLDSSATNTLIDIGHTVEGTGISTTVKVIKRVVDTITLDTAVTVADGVTLTFKEVAYTSNGFTNFSADGSGVIEGLLSSCAGKLSYINGKFVMFAGVNRSATLSINDDNLLAPIQITTKQATGETFNSVKSIYVDANNNYVATDSPTYEDSTFLSEDTPTGESSANYKKVLELQLPFTDTTTMAQRLQKSALLHQRKQVTINVLCNINFLKLQPNDWVYVTNERLSYSNKTFEVLSTNLEVIESDGVQVLATRLALKEIDNTVYTFSSSDYNNPIDEGSSVSTGDFSVSAPTGLSVSATLINTGYDLNVQWTNIQDDNIQGTEILYGTTSGTYTGSLITGKGVAKEIINNVKPNTTYYIVARHFSNNNVFSSYTSEVTINTASTGDITAPSTPTSLSATTGKPLSIGLSWTNPSNSDLRDIKIYRSTSSGFTPNDGTNLVRTIAGVPSVSQKVSFGIDDGLVAGTTYYFKVKAVSFFDKESSASSQASGSFTKVEATDIDAIFSGYFHVEGSTTTALTDSAFNTAHGRLPIEDDILIMVDTSASPKVSKAYKYSGTSGSGGSFVEINNFQTGDLVVDGTIAGSKIIANDITANQIASETITANELATDSVIASKINVTNLQAISSDLGSITAGSLNIGSGNFTVSTAGVMTATGSTISGNVTTTTLVVTEDADVIGNLKATSLASNIVKITNLHQEVWNEIDARTATTQNGFYDEFTSAGGVGYIGVEKNFELLGSGDNGYQVNSKDVTLRGGSVSFIGSSTTEFTGTALQFTAQYQYKLLPSGNWTNAGSSYTATADVAESGGTYYYEVDADPDATITGLTSGSYYQFRLKISPVVTTNVYRVSPTGAADSNGITVIFEVQQSSTSTGTGAGTVTSVGSGDGLSGGPITGSGTLAVDSTVVRTTGTQTIGGDKTFSDDIVIQGNLDVQGTTTTIDTTNLDVQDKNITLNYGSGDTSANANGAGITIQDAVSATQDATLTWNTANDSFNFSHDLNFADSIKANFGTDEDLQIQHNGTNSSITNSTGSLNIQNNANDADINLISDDGSGGTTTYFKLDGSLGYSRALQNIRFDDNVKTTFGTGEDLQIYHTGSHSYIDSYTGNLYINSDSLQLTSKTGGENYIRAFLNGAVDIYYDNAVKLATTSTGVDITGTIVGDGLTIQGTTNLNGSVKASVNSSSTGLGNHVSSIRINNTDSTVNNWSALVFDSNSGASAEVSARFIDHTNNYADLYLITRGTGGYTTKLNIGSDGDVDIVSGDLQLGGQTVISSARNITAGTIDSGAIDVTGTVTSDGLTVDGTAQINGTSAGQLTLDATGQYNQIIFEQNSASNSGGDIIYDHTNDQLWLRSLAVGSIHLKTGTTAGNTLDRFKVASNGDISFYDDTGTSQNLKWDASADTLNFVDNAKATFGTGSDLSIYHNGAGSFIDEQGTGGLVLRGTNLFLRNSADENYIGAISDGSVTLYHNNLPKLATTSTGVDVTGTVTSDGVSVDGNINLGDNDSIYLGDSNDLRIYHDSGSSLIRNTTGNLYIQDDDGHVYIRPKSGQDGLVAIADGAVTLHHSGNAKLATTSSGIDITGTASATNTSSGVTTGLKLSNNTSGANNRVAIDFHTAFTKYGVIEGGYGSSSPEMNFKVGNPPAQILNLNSSGVDVTGNITIPTGNKVAFDTDGLTYITEDQDERLRVWVHNTEFIRMTNTTTDELRLLPYGGNVFSGGNLDVTGTASADILQSKNGKIFLDDNGTHNGIINAPASLFINFDSDNTSASEKIVFGYDRDSTSSGTTVMEIDSSGINVTGTVVSDGLTVSTAGNLTALLDSTSGTPKLQFRSGSGTLSSFIQGGVGGTANLSFQTNGTTERMAIEANGDISFYEDTGTTAKFFWDASAESLGIGLTNPSEKLEVSGKIKASGQIRAGSYLESFPSFSFANDTDTGMFSDTANQLEFSTGGSSRLVINSSGNANFAGDLTVTSELNVGQQITASGGITTDQSGQTISGFTTIRVGDALIGQDVATLTTTATTQTNRILASATTYRTLKVIVQIKSSTNFHATEILLTHNGTTVYMTEYATIFSNTSLATFDADISGGNIRLLIDPNQSASTEFKFNVSGIEA